MISYICSNRDANVLFLGCFILFYFFMKLMISETLFYNLLLCYNSVLWDCFIVLCLDCMWGAGAFYRRNSLCTWRKFSFASILRCVYKCPCLSMCAWISCSNRRNCQLFKLVLFPEFETRVQCSCSIFFPINFIRELSSLTAVVSNCLSWSCFLNLKCVFILHVVYIRHVGRILKLTEIMKVHACFWLWNWYFYI
jgi:hypothetical protein